MSFLIRGFATRSPGKRGRGSLFALWHILLGSSVAALTSTTIVRANTVLATISGSSGNLAGQAQFSTDGTNLFLTLTNVAAAASDGPAGTLNAILFDGSLSTFSPVSAMVTSGSDVYKYVPEVPEVKKKGKVITPAIPASWAPFSWGANPVGVVGGEWGTGTNLNVYSQTWDYGISSTGLSYVFGHATFPGANLAGPDALDGNQFGLVSSATVSSPPPSNFSGTNNTPVVATSVTFNLGLGTKVNITKMLFQYGTAVGEPNYSVVVPVVTVPLPGGAWMGMGLMASVGGIGVLRKRRLQLA